LPIAWEREQSSRLIGLRTFPIVAVASCGYVLVAQSFLGENADALARVIQGLTTGIGFVGGGAILKQGDVVRGTATAASVWSTGAIGAAAAFGRYEIGIAIAAINVFVFRVFTPVKEMMGSDVDDGSEEER